MEWPKIDGYEILDLLGVGGMGAVFLARDTRLNRRVAIKSLTSVGRVDASLARQLQLEGQVLAKLRHDNIVQVFDLVSDDTGTYCLVLELVEGASLDAILDRMTPGMSLKCVSDVCAALHYLAEHGVIHRDIKPSNILVSIKGVCKLADFGIVKLLETSLHQSDVSRLTLDGPAGTAAYISPEAAAGRQIGTAADVYSLGVLTYELLVGQRPFDEAKDADRAREAHIEQRPPRPDALVDGFPRAVGRVLLAPLSKKPSARPKPMAFWRALDRAASAAWPGWREEASIGTVVAAVRRQPALRPEEASDDTLKTGDPERTIGTQGGDTVLPPLARGFGATTRRGGKRGGRGQRTQPLLGRAVHGRRWVRYTFLVVTFVVISAVSVTLRDVRSVPDRSPQLVVSEIALTLVDQSDARCPEAQYTVRADVLTNGEEGAISYRWEQQDGRGQPDGGGEQPDGAVGDVRVETVPAGVSRIVETLHFTVPGGPAHQGSIVFHLLAPSDIYSSALAYNYQCA